VGRAPATDLIVDQQRIILLQRTVYKWQPKYMCRTQSSRVYIMLICQTVAPVFLLSFSRFPVCSMKSLLKFNKFHNTNIIKSIAVLGFRKYIL